MVQTLRGVPARHANVGTRRRPISDAVAESLVVLVALAFAGLLFGVGIIVGRATKGNGGGGTLAVSTSTAVTTTTTTSAAGEKIFKDNCGSCHTLKAAGTSGSIGPNLDEAKPSKQLVVDRVTSGSGVMPSFKGQLRDAQIAAVADYVSERAGKP